VDCRRFRTAVVSTLGEISMKIFTASSLALVVWTGLASAQDAVGPRPSPTPSDAAEHERVIVSSTPLGGDLFEQTQSVTVLTGQELELRLEPSIGETLNREPGISSTYFGPGASRPVIRGLGEDRIRVLQNGVTTIDASQISPDHAVSAEPLTIKTIDVVRGPATLLYGPNTVGGVVNLIDNRIATEPLQRPLMGKVDARFSTAEEQRSGAGLVEFQLGRVVVHLDGFKRSTEDIEIPASRAQNGCGACSRSRKAKSSRAARCRTASATAKVARGRVVRLGRRLHRRGVFSFRYDLRHRRRTDVTIGLEQRRWDVRGAFNKPFSPSRRSTTSGASPTIRTRSSKGRKSARSSTWKATTGAWRCCTRSSGLLEGGIGYQTQRTDFSRSARRRSCRRSRRNARRLRL
jgi:iron complex outermembrane receptor protein